MTTWTTTFRVEPWLDTPWDRRDLELWQDASALQTYATEEHRRGVLVTVAVDATDEGTAIAAGRERVDAFFPPSRYTIQNPHTAPSDERHRLLQAGAALFLRQTGTRRYGDDSEKR